MNLTVISAKLFLVVLTGVLVWLVMSRHLKMPVVIEFGLALIALATYGAVDSMFAADHVSSQEYVAARWLLAGTGVALILSYVVWRLFRGKKNGEPMDGRRITDYVGLDDGADKPKAPPEVDIALSVPPRP